MRYFVTGEQHRKSLLNTLVLMFLGYIALLWVSNGLMYFHHMDLTAKSVVEYYLGSEEQFTQPRSYQGMLEVSHFHLFAMGMLVVPTDHFWMNSGRPVKSQPRPTPHSAPSSPSPTAAGAAGSRRSG